MSETRETVIADITMLTLPSGTRTKRNQPSLEAESGNQRSEEILDAFATIFAGSGGCVAVGVIRDWEKKVVHMIIAGNSTNSGEQQKQIRDMYMGLKEIAAASEAITDRQSLPKHSAVLEDSPPKRRYERLP
ncbi:hypothetical protein MMC31_004459 [Peltigera leucophlebia]|nr:hypothetical protein [Peltigera leucophlebia]